MTARPSAPPVERFLDLVEQRRHRDAIDLALEHADRSGVAAAVTDLLAPAQREVGERWHLGRYTVAQEHLVSGVVDDVLGLLAPRTLRHVADDDTLALVCAEGEWHSTPARMAALLARDAGWRVEFLGASTPADHLRATLRDLVPQAMGISCTLPLALAGVPGLVAVGRELGLPVVVGGRAFGSDGHRALAVGADAVFGDPRAAVQTLEGWLDAPPRPPVPEPDEDLIFQRSVLAARRPEVVDDAYTVLERRLPIMAGFDAGQRQHTRTDLDFIVGYCDVSLLVDDARLFAEFAVWLSSLLTSRGLPEDVLPVTLDAVRDVVGADLPAVHGILAAGRQRLDQQPDG